MVDGCFGEMPSMMLLELFHGFRRIVIAVEHPVLGGETVQSKFTSRIINHNVPIEAKAIPSFCEINSVGI